MFHEMGQAMFFQMFVSGAGVDNQAKMGHLGVVWPVNEPDPVLKLVCI